LGASIFGKSRHFDLEARMTNSSTSTVRQGAASDARKIHVLVVSNHKEGKNGYVCSGVFADRQVVSLQKLGVNVTTFDIGSSHSPIPLLRKYLELRRIGRTLMPDIVHGRYGTIVGFVSAFAGRPAVITFCGGDLLSGQSVNIVRQFLGFLLSNMAALGARRTICVSEGLRQALWWKKDRAVVIPDGIDLDLFTPGQQNDARKELGWDPDSHVIIFNEGNDPITKGLDLAKAAFELVRSKVPTAELRVICNVEPKQMPLYYRGADVLLSASRSEGSPNVVKEALACNLPVVSTPVGDVPERLAGVYPSAIVPRDADQIAGALTKILTTKQRCNGREHVIQLGLEQVARRVIDVYRSALRTKH
jgi:teichuronic acid biosynthesis glycosyltransferase TuaC